MFGTGADANGGLTDAAGSVLAEHPGLEKLTLARPEFTEAILVPLQKAPALKELILEFDQHTPEGLSLLRKFPNLQTLRIGG